MRLLTIATFLLTIWSFAPSALAQHRGGASHPGNFGINQHQYQAQSHVYNYDRGTNFYNNNYRPGLYGNRPGYAYNPYRGFGVINPLYFNNLSYPIYGGYPSYSNLPLGSNALATCPYPYGSQQYRWCFFRQYGYWPY